MAFYSVIQNRSGKFNQDQLENCIKLIQNILVNNRINKLKQADLYVDYKNSRILSPKDLESSQNKNFITLISDIILKSQKIIEQILKTPITELKELYTVINNMIDEYFT